jgi:hypothetical protein
VKGVVKIRIAPVARNVMRTVTVLKSLVKSVVKIRIVKVARNVTRTVCVKTIPVNVSSAKFVWMAHV